MAGALHSERTAELLPIKRAPSFFGPLGAILEGRFDLAATLILSLPNRGNRTFASRLGNAVVAGSVYRDQRRPFTVKAAVTTTDRHALRLEDRCRMLRVNTPTLVGQFRSMS